MNSLQGVIETIVYLHFCYIDLCWLPGGPMKKLDHETVKYQTRTKAWGWAAKPVYETNPTFPRLQHKTHAYNCNTNYAHLHMSNDALNYILAWLNNMPIYVPKSQRMVLRLPKLATLPSAYSIKWQIGGAVSTQLFIF